jgi:hypothetical protein
MDVFGGRAGQINPPYCSLYRPRQAKRWPRNDNARSDFSWRAQFGRWDFVHRAGLICQAARLAIISRR